MFCISLLIEDKPPMYNGFHHQQLGQIQLHPYKRRIRSVHDLVLSLLDLLTRYVAPAICLCLFRHIFRSFFVNTSALVVGTHFLYMQQE